MKKLISAIALMLLALAFLASPVSALEIIGASSADEHPDYLAIYAIDGDDTKFWHTNWEAEGGQGPLPISIDFELDGVYNIEGVTILPRQDGNFNGLIYIFNVYVSTDGQNYTLAAENCEFIYDSVAQTATFKSVPAKFVRIEALDTEGGFVSINQFSVVASAEQPAPVAPEPAAEETQPAPEPEAPASEPAPEPAADAAPIVASQTSDIGSIVAAGLVLSAAAAAMLNKKRR